MEPQESNEFPNAFYRVTIKGLCVRDGKFLMVKESDALSGKWELPGGGLDFGEDIYTGLNREAQEEMGLNISKISRAPVYLWTHKYQNKRNLKWFYSLVVVYRIEFENLDFTPTDECMEIKFFSKSDLQSVQLNGQMTNLEGTFNLEDFKQDF